MLTPEKVIAEIRRTTAENGGKPLGKQNFFLASGIKESDWSGRFWIKWSDALQAAGYAPNKMQDAFSDRHLFEKYAMLVRELGHIPTSPEVRMKARNAADFPSHNTFSRLGSKQQFLNKFLTFCSDDENYSDLRELLKSIPGAELEPETVGAASKSENGYVYLLLFGAEYKIGSSNSVERRFREIKTQMPYEGKIVHSIATGDPAGIEAYWHNYFKDKRLKGEWFKLNPNDLRYFKKRKLM